jgi:hypothetical protein
MLEKGWEGGGGGMCVSVGSVVDMCVLNELGFAPHKGSHHTKDLCLAKNKGIQDNGRLRILRLNQEFVCSSTQRHTGQWPVADSSFKPRFCV